MTKPREKTREELTAEIEGGKKKIRQYENREKVLRQKLSQEERRTRSHRLIVRGAVFESIVPEAKTSSRKCLSRVTILWVLFTLRTRWGRSASICSSGISMPAASALIIMSTSTASLNSSRQMFYRYIAIYSPWASINSSHMPRMSSTLSSAAVWGSSMAA